jgi:hypothetical protein
MSKELGLNERGYSNRNVGYIIFSRYESQLIFGVESIK